MDRTTRTDDKLLATIEVLINELERQFTEKDIDDDRIINKTSEMEIVQNIRRLLSGVDIDVLTKNSKQLKYINKLLEGKKGDNRDQWSPLTKISRELGSMTNLLHHLDAGSEDLVDSKTESSETKVSGSGNQLKVCPYETSYSFSNQSHPMIPYPAPPLIIELRGGDLFKGCLCLKRNGLQQDCPLTSCQGLEECVHWPDPVCLPSGLGKPVVRLPFVKREVSKCDKDALAILEKKIQSSLKKNKTEDKDAERRKLQAQLDAEVRAEAERSIKEKTLCKRIDCNYIKRGTKRSKKVQTDDETPETGNPEETKQTQVPNLRSEERLTDISATV